MQSVLSYLESISAILPLPLFVLIGSLAEEIIAPIPSPFVLTLAGSLAAAQNVNFISLIGLALIAALAKTAGSYLFYVVADKTEDILTGKFGRLIGFSHKSIESIGKKLEKSSRDEIAIFLLRATPLIPTAPVSVVAGLVKLEVKRYLIASFAGLWVRAIFFLYMGYTAQGTLSDLTNQLSGYETYGKIFLLLMGVVGVVYFYRKRKKIHS